jgi:hypothetical protein
MEHGQRVYISVAKHKKLLSQQEISGGSLIASNARLGVTWDSVTSNMAYR